MPKYRVEFLGVSGPGTGGHYVYTARADTPELAVSEAWAKADRPLARLNRGGTLLDPRPTAIHPTT